MIWEKLHIAIIEVNIAICDSDIINGTMSQLDWLTRKMHTQIRDNGQMCICKTRKCFQNNFYTMKSHLH